MKTLHSCSKHAPSKATVAQLCNKGQISSSERYMPIRDRRLVLMKRIYINIDVFFHPQKGPLPRGKLGWNVVFLDTVVQIVEGVGDTMTEEILLQLVVTIHNKITREQGGRFFIKVANLQQIPDCWEEMSIEKAYRVIFKCIGAVAKKNGIKFPGDENVHTKISRPMLSSLAELARQNQQVPDTATSADNNTTTSHHPILAQLSSDAKSCDVDTQPTNETLDHYKQAVLHRIQSPSPAG